MAAKTLSVFEIRLQFGFLMVSFMNNFDKFKFWIPIYVSKVPFGPHLDQNWVPYYVGKIPKMLYKLSASLSGP